MEPKPIVTSRPNPTNDQENIDLGLLVYKTGGVLNNLMTRTGRAFSRLGNMILRFIFFLRRNLVWILLGAIAGLGWGLFITSKNGVKYSSEITVRTNFNSTRALYSSLDFFNALVNNRQIDKLSKIFEISPAEASSLVYFEASASKSEMITAEIYREQFLKLDRNTKFRMDTFWINAVKYVDFKKSLTKFDYPLHTINVISTNALIFPKIQQGLVDQISQNKLLQQIKSTEEQTNRDEVNLLTSSIEGLDTLRRTYNQRLSKTGTGSESGNNVMLLDGNNNFRNPELDLYDKLLELKDELKKAKTQASLESAIIQIYSPFNAIGQRESFLKQNTLKYTILGLLISLILLLLIKTYKYLGKLEKTKSKVVI